MAALEFEHVGKTFSDGTRAVDDVSLQVEDGEFVVLVGPSGCGKTTALRMVAGLEEVTDGLIRIGERVVNYLEPRERDVAMVFQNYALYPQMNVFDNMAFGLRMRKAPKDEMQSRVGRISRMLGLDELLKRKPGNLSGGQRQRVAMGRAIARQPQMFLMDEPLSNLDAKLRVHMRAEIAKLQRELGVTTLYVTHDQVEAMTMGTRIAVMRRGKLQQFGPPQELYDRPANLFVASFMGSPAMNLLEADVVAANGDVALRIGDQELPLPAEATAERPSLRSYLGRTVAAGFRPEHLRPAGAEAAPRLRGSVKLVEALGSELLAHVETSGKVAVSEEVLEGSAVEAEEEEVLFAVEGRGGAVVVARVDPDTPMEAGDSIELAINVRKLRLFDLESGAAI
jgi:multiple sugar transport system ATP-binding protein